MNFVSDIYNGKAYFGGYPSSTEVYELLSHGVTVFVDLTTPHERSRLPFVYINHLPADVHYVNFPIYDNQTPQNRHHFLAFLKDIATYIKNDKKIYIHCKGGHGRSGIVVASLLCLLCGMTPHKALVHCTNLHSRRPNLKQKWKHVSCPQLYRQQKYVHELFVHQKETVASDVIVQT